MRKFYDYNRPYRFTVKQERDISDAPRADIPGEPQQDAVNAAAVTGEEGAPLSYKARRYLAMMNRHDRIVNSIKSTRTQ